MVVLAVRDYSLKSAAVLLSSSHQENVSTLSVSQELLLSHQILLLVDVELSRLEIGLVAVCVQVDHGFDFGEPLVSLLLALSFE
jgi:hypothetical protein